MDAFVTKPFQADHLRTQIMSLVQERRPLSVAPPVAETPAGLDLRTLHDVVGGDQELREELIAIFVREVPLAMARMQEALDTDDPQALYRAAHTVKPSLILFGLPGVEPLVRTLEDAGKIAHVGQQERQAYAMLRSRVKEAVASLSQAPDIQNL
jgi:HPt (histidine-containing phosphotransfer) domain-containing protein